MLDHEPPRRRPLQALGHRLAELAQPPAAAGTGPRARMHDAVPRQVLGQSPAGRPRTLKRPDLRCGSALGVFQVGRRVELGRALLQVLERQHELLEADAPLGGGAEALVPELGDLELELLDLNLERDPGRLREGRVDLSRPARAVGFDESGAGPRLGLLDPPGHGADQRVGAVQRVGERVVRHAPIRAWSPPVATLMSSSGARTPSSLGMAPVDALEQVAELGRGDRDHPVSGRGPQEAALLQPLREQAEALPVVPEAFDEVAATASENEQMAIVRIALERLLYQ